MTIQLPHLEDYQRFLLDTYIAHQRDTIITVSARRQIGKSIGVEVLLIWAALNQRGLSMYVAPTREQSRKCYNDIIRILQDTILIKKKNDALLQLQLLNGSEILFKSSEQKDGLRGNTVSTVLVIDEASFIPDSTIYELCLPMTNVFRATTILVSTPKWKQGAFYENYMRGMEHLPGFITINYNEWDTSKYLSNEKLEMYRRTLPKLVFQSEYLGEFISGEGSVFDNFRQCVAEYTIDPELPVYMSIDWGANTGNDYTVVTIGQLQQNKLRIEKQVSWNSTTTDDTITKIITEIQRLVRDHCKTFNIIVEKNSIGNVFYSLMAERINDYVEKYNVDVSYKDEIEVNCSTFVTTQKSKDTIIKQLATLFEQSLITIPNDEKLLTELSTYECKVNTNGLCIYNAPAGLHDDTVMSLAFLMRDLYNEII